LLANLGLTGSKPLFSHLKRKDQTQAQSRESFEEPLQLEALVQQESNRPGMQHL
jgi:hypothetical protein